LKSSQNRNIFYITLFASVLMWAISAVAYAQSAPTQGFLGRQLEHSSTIVRLLSLYVVGLGLALTPCVYPMIGVTLGYFGSQKGYGGRKSAFLAGIYVLGIAITYSILGTITALTGSLFGGIMQNPWVVGGISLLLVALALSMFGLYEIRPPAALSNKATARGGVAGALFMGLIFGLVAGPCVAPVLLALLTFVAKSQSVFTGFSSFFFVALGMGTPLFILALFAARLPAPGVWMTAVNRIAGFLLLAVAAYFAGPLLPHSISNLLIPAIIGVAGLWLGFIDKSLQSTTRLKTIFTTLGTLLIVVSIFMVLPAQRKGAIEDTKLRWTPYSEAGLKNAAELGIPVFIDFYADWCGVCQEYENGTFKDPEFIHATKGIITLRADYTNKDDQKMAAILDKWGVAGLPTLVFIDKSGKEVVKARVVGIESKETLIKILNSIK